MRLTRPLERAVYTDVRLQRLLQLWTSAAIKDGRKVIFTLILRVTSSSSLSGEPRLSRVLSSVADQSVVEQVQIGMKWQSTACSCFTDAQIVL
jgi:hypothetical protein